MSLVIWLPLNGNLNNQGISDITFSTSTATVSNDGKIGQCYTFTQTTGNGIYSPDNGLMSRYINGRSSSFALWFKTTESNTILIALSYGYRLKIESGKIYLSLGNSDRTIAFTGTSTVNDGKWHHACSTYNAITNKICIYVDGNLETTASYTDGYVYSSSWSNGLYVGRDPNDSTANATFFFKGSMNDVRIFDHCLSSKKVKMISQCLVIHYKLSDPYSNSIINFSSQSTNTGGWNNSGTSTRSNNDTTIPKLFANSPIYSIKQLTAGNSAMTWGNVSTTTNSQLQGNQVTASVYVFLDEESVSGNTVYLRSTVNDNKAGNNICNFSYKGSTNPQTWDKNKWIRVSATGTVDPNETSIYFCTYTNNANEKRYFTGWQIELGDTLSPFVNGIFNPPSTITDSSGFGYHATKNGTLKKVQNASIYTISTSFDGEGDAITIPFTSAISPSGEGIFTMNCWAFHDDTWSSKSWETLFGGPSGFELDMKNDSTNSPYFYAYSWGKNYAAYTLNSWHMFTMTRTPTETKFYIDGQLKMTGTAGTIPNGDYFIGSWYTKISQNFKGLINDFRIYATELTPQEIENLYNIRASIDKNGNLFCGEFVEE